jgi:hypothetical protein
MSWLRDKRLRLAKKARKGDTNYIHAQLLLAGQTVDKDEIVGSSHIYHFDCGCIRSYSVPAGSKAVESLSACKRHKELIRRRNGSDHSS